MARGEGRGMAPKLNTILSPAACLRGNSADESRLYTTSLVSDP